MAEKLAAATAARFSIPRNHHHHRGSRRRRHEIVMAAIISADCSHCAFYKRPTVLRISSMIFSAVAFSLSWPKIHQIYKVSSRWQRVSRLDWIAMKLEAVLPSGHWEKHVGVSKLLVIGIYIIKQPRRTGNNKRAPLVPLTTDSGLDFPGACLVYYHHPRFWRSKIMIISRSESGKARGWKTWREKRVQIEQEWRKILPLIGEKMFAHKLDGSKLGCLAEGAISVTIHYYCCALAVDVVLASPLDQSEVMSSFLLLLSNVLCFAGHQSGPICLSQHTSNTNKPLNLGPNSARFPFR